MPVVPFNPSTPAPAPRQRVDPVLLIAAAADLHQADMLIQPSGQIEEGNIDLDNRPQVKNPDGSTSTVRSITITDDAGKATVIPTVVGDKVLSNEDAISHYKKTGEHLGRFDNEDAASEYAQRLHRSQAKKYGLE